MKLKEYFGGYRDLSRVFTDSFYDTLADFIREHPDFIDLNKVSETYAGLRNYFTDDLCMHAAFSTICNAWLGTGFNPLTKLKEVPPYYGTCIEQDTITVPSNCVRLNSYAFYRSKVKQVILSNGVKTIGEFAFSRCADLENVSFPSTLKTVKEDAFSGCVNLHRVDVEDPEQLFRISYDAFSHQSSVPFNDAKGGSFYCNGSVVTDLVTPSDIDSIKTCALRYCTGLKSVKITSNVSRISYFAFSGCINLSDVTIEEGVVTIGASAFAKCPSLKQVVIPKSATDVRPGAFTGKTEVING